jgi:hypothetical protein
VPFDPSARIVTPKVGVTPVVTAATAANFDALTSNASKSKLLEAVRHGHGSWRQQARFQNIVINGVSAIGVPGCLTGPALEPLIKSAPGVVGDGGDARGLRDAVARGVSTCFGLWQGAVTVPGLPWYPPFAAWPGPQAPPTPNLAVPLISCPSGSVAKLGESELRQGIVANLPPPLRVSQVETCVGCLAQSLAVYFLQWLGMQQVTSVLGYGPVPSYAPPLGPHAGPVVNGSVISAPGHLTAGGQPIMVVL